MTKKVLLQKSVILMSAALTLAACGKNNTQENATQTQQTTAGTAVKEVSVVYVQNDSLLSNYTLFKELSEEMLKKEENARATLNEQQRDLEKDAMDFQRKLQNNAFATQQRAEEENARILKKQQDLQALSEKLQTQLLTEQQKNSVIVMDSVQNVLKEISKEFGYKIIVSDPLYGDNSLDITNLVIERLNARYKSEKK